MTKAEELATKYAGDCGDEGGIDGWEVVVAIRNAVNEALEWAASQCEAERVDEEDTGEDEDKAYNCAIAECAKQIRAGKSQ